MRQGRRWSLLLAIILVAVLVSSCVPTPNNSRLPEKKAEPTDTVAVKVYFGSHDAKQLEAEVYQLKKGDLLLQRAMEILVAGPRNPDLWPVVPAVTKVKGVLVKERTAYVDFSGDIVKLGFGGSSREILAVAAIVNTLTEFPEVEQVQILVEGKKVNSLFGHVDISGPLGRSPAIIKGN